MLACIRACAILACRDRRDTLSRLQDAHTSAYVSIRQRMSAYVSVRQLMLAYVSIRQHTSAYVSLRQLTSAYVSVCQHTSAYVSIRQHTLAYVSIRRHILVTKDIHLVAPAASRFESHSAHYASATKPLCH
jgi:hypothetical protein